MQDQSQPSRNQRKGPKNRKKPPQQRDAGFDSENSNSSLLTRGSKQNQSTQNNARPRNSKNQKSKRDQDEPERISAAERPYVQNSLTDEAFKSYKGPPKEALAAMKHLSINQSQQPKAVNGAQQSTKSLEFNDKPKSNFNSAYDFIGVYTLNDAALGVIQQLHDTSIVNAFDPEVPGDTVQQYREFSWALLRVAIAAQIYRTENHLHRIVAKDFENIERSLETLLVHPIFDTAIQMFGTIKTPNGYIRPANGINAAYSLLSQPPTFNGFIDNPYFKDLINQRLPVIDDKEIPYGKYNGKEVVLPRNNVNSFAHLIPEESIRAETVINLGNRENLTNFFQVLGFLPLRSSRNTDPRNPNQRETFNVTKQLCIEHARLIIQQYIHCQKPKGLRQLKFFDTGRAAQLVTNTDAAQGLADHMQFRSTSAFSLGPQDVDIGRALQLGRWQVKYPLYKGAFGETRDQAMASLIDRTSTAYNYY